MSKTEIQKLKLATAAIIERRLKRKYRNIEKLSKSYDTYIKLILEILSPSNVPKYKRSLTAYYSTLDLIEDLINSLPEIEGSEEEKEKLKKIFETDYEKVYKLKEEFREKFLK